MNTANKLIDQFHDALDLIPHLVFEIGYTRVTGWMVHVWDSTGTGIKDAKKVFTCQNDDVNICIGESIIRLKGYIQK